MAGTPPVVCRPPLVKPARGGLAVVWLQGLRSPACVFGMPAMRGKVEGGELPVLEHGGTPLSDPSLRSQRGRGPPALWNPRRLRAFPPPSLVSTLICSERWLGCPLIVTPAQPATEPKPTPRRSSGAAGGRFGSRGRPQRLGWRGGWGVRLRPGSCQSVAPPTRGRWGQELHTAEVLPGFVLVNLTPGEAGARPAVQTFEEGVAAANLSPGPAGCSGSARPCRT
jgi:hypothetical protein